MFFSLYNELDYMEFHSQNILFCGDVTLVYLVHMHILLFAHVNTVINLFTFHIQCQEIISDNETPFVCFIVYLSTCPYIHLLMSFLSGTTVVLKSVPVLYINQANPPSAGSNNFFVIHFRLTEINF